MGGHGVLPRRPDPYALNHDRQPSMIRWFIVILLALMLINGLTPLLHKLGFGKLPGDVSFRLFGRDWFIPLTTTILLSLLVSFVAKLI